MSVTPDFLGQVYKDTATGNLWRANSTTAGDWTLELQNFKLKWTPVSIGLRISTLLGVFDCNNNPSLTTLEILFTSVATNFLCYNNTSLTALSALFPSITNDLYCYTNTSLLTVNFSSLTTIGNGVQLYDNGVLTTASFPSLTSVGNDFECHDNSSLTTLNIPSLTTLDGDMYAPENAFSSACINGILARLILCNSSAWANGAYLSGGTSQSPTGQGLIDKAALITRGATVETN